MTNCLKVDPSSMVCVTGVRMRRRRRHWRHTSLPSTSSTHVTRCHKMSQVTPYFALTPLHCLTSLTRSAREELVIRWALNMWSASFFLLAWSTMSILWWDLDEKGKMWKDVERCGKPFKSDSKLIHFVAFGHLRVLDLHLARVQPCVLFLSRTWTTKGTKSQPKFLQIFKYLCDFFTLFGRVLVWMPLFGQLSVSRQTLCGRQRG